LRELTWLRRKIPSKKIELFQGKSKEKILKSFDFRIFLSNNLIIADPFGGDKRDRTADLLNAMAF